MTAPVVTFQGIDVPQESVQPDAFFALTRRHRNPEKNAVYQGLGLTDTVELKKSDIIAGIHVRFSGNLAITLNGGTVASTLRWPYDLIKAARLTANGQSNLINVSGAKLKVRPIMVGDYNDRGIVQTVGASSVNQGTLSKSSESWGVGSGAAALATGNYAVELEWFIPIAEDDKLLAGAIFAQTSTMDITLNIDWEQQVNLFATTGAPTIALTGNVIVETEKYSIPSINGLMVVPDLSVFHSLIQTRYTALATGDNEIRLIGQGAGKRLLRVYYQTWNGNAPQVPLAAVASNYGAQSWRYGTNETPETYADARSMRQINETEYGNDIGAVFGFLSHDFAAVNAFRDSVDQGQTSELRLVVNIASAVNLTTPAVEYVQETIFAAGA